MKKVLTLLFTLLSIGAIAQQDAQYTQYMFNMLSVNPAYAGSRNAISPMLIFRKQWVGIEKSPLSFAASIHAPMRENMGIGLYLENDIIGVHNRFTAMGSYAYQIPIGTQGAKLALGLQAGVLHYTSDWAQASIQQPGDPVIDQNTSKLLPNFGLGAYYFAERYYVGFSIPHLLDSTLDNVTETASQYKHYFLSGGMVFDLSSSLKLKPTILIKSVPGYAPLEADINANLLIKDMFWVGLGYRTGDAINALLQYNMKNGFRVGYAYDFTLSKLNNYTSGSHEIMLGWDFGSRKIDKILSPRYF